jgi:predicted  nucleic acid-binding Zn-ribbon protein
MIGDVPKGAGPRCKMGFHKGQERGGLMVFTCPRCGGDFWQTNPKYRAAMERVRVAEAVNDMDEAKRIYEETTGRPL